MLYHIFIMLLKLDVFFFIGFSIQFLVLVLGSSASTNMVDILTHGLIAFPGALALLVIAYMAVHRESKILMYATLVGLLAGAGYLISKLVDISRNGETDKYSGCSKSLAWFGKKKKNEV